MSQTTSAIYLASRLNALSRDYLTAALAKANLSDLEPCHGDLFNVLFVEDGLGLVELAVRSGRSKSTVSVMVRRLVSLGYLTKTTDEADVRAVKIHLTDKARALKPVFDRISEQMQAVLTENIHPTSLRTLESLLTQAVKNFEAQR